jgi:tRNA(Ile)-lysidine synthase
VEYIDAGTVGNRKLVLRSWREGDAFVPLGMKGKKKVSDFLIDEKVPAFDKPTIPVLETEEGEIVWLCGRRIDERFKISHDTHKILKLEFRRHTDEKDRQG